VKPQPWLWPLSIPYQTGVEVRNRLYDLGVFASRKIAVPIVSVGNISAGGSGKTPFVLHLVDRMRRLHIQKNFKPAIISRGYKGSARDFAVVSDGKRILSDPFESGDEPYMMAEARSGAVIIVDRDRIRGAELAVEQFKASAILLDDGFQHRRLWRDLDIVLIKTPVRSKLLLPAGNLREPLKSLKRAGLIVLSKPDGAPEEVVEQAIAMKKWTGKPSVASKLVPERFRRLGKNETFDLKEVEGKRIAAVAGIAYPDSFFDTLADLGAELVEEIPLPDHCDYGKFYLDKIARRFTLSHAEWLVTTAKDAVKFPPILKILPVFALDVKVEMIFGEDLLDEALREALRRKDI